MKLFRILYILAGLVTAVTIAVLLVRPGAVLETDGDDSPESITSRVLTDDITMRSRAMQIAAGCPDRECSAFVIYEHLRKNSELLYESADITEKTVLLASYFENIGIPVQLVFTDKRPYLLGCGLSREKLYGYIIADRLEEPAFADSARIAQGQVWTKVYDGKAAENIIIDVNASAPVSLCLFNSAQSVGFCSGSGSLSECREENLTKLRKICRISPNNVLGIEALKENTRFEMALATIDATEADISVSIYKNKPCVPFDFGIEGWLPDQSLKRIATSEPKR